MKHLRHIGFLALLTLMVLPLYAQDTAILESNLTDTCVSDFDPDVNYFPDQVIVEYSDGFTVEYFNNYKVVTVLSPWPNATADQTFQYVLVQCGTPAPEGFEDTPVIEVPVQRLATMSTTYLPYVVEYGLLDRLVGVDTLGTVTSAGVIEKSEAGELVEIAPNFELNIETVLELDPDLIMTYGFGFETDGYLQLQDAGLSIALNGEFSATDPLSRAEWGKYMALFFNAEAKAQASFDAVVNVYQDLETLVAESETRPTAFLNSPFDGTWFMAGGQSYMANFINDANAEYVWSDDETSGTLFLDFEAVFDQAAEADFWLNASQIWFTEADALAEDARYAEFAAFENGNVWINNRALTENFGNDFFETGVARPDLILADLVAIFHPELLPDHEFIYYQRLSE